MRICLLGAQGTGKTTLLKNFEQYPIYDNIARSVISSGGSSNQEGNARSQKVIFDLYEEHVYTDYYLSTRSVIDVLSYTKYLLLNIKVRNLGDWIESIRLRLEFKRELRHTLKWIKRNPDVVICYIPVEIPLVNDGVRSINVIYQQVIDSIMKDYFDRLPVIYKYIIKGTIEQRTTQLEYIIKAHD